MLDTELKDIIVKVKKNDDGAFELLAEKYLPLINSISESFNRSAVFAGSEDISKDLKQDLTLALFKAANSFDTEQDKVTFGLYAKRCLYYKAVSVLRKVKSDVRRENRMKVKLKKDFSVENRIPELSDFDRNAFEMKISEFLSDFELSVFRLYLDGLSVSEISAAVGKNEKSVHNAVFRSKTKVRKYIKSESSF